jgi:chromate transporter
MNLLALVFFIFVFNLLTFGSGPVMVPLLQHHLVEQNGLLTLDQFLYAYALGRATPG